MTCPVALRTSWATRTVSKPSRRSSPRSRRRFGRAKSIACSPSAGVHVDDRGLRAHVPRAARRAWPRGRCQRRAVGRWASATNTSSERVCALKAVSSERVGTASSPSPEMIGVPSGRMAERRVMRSCPLARARSSMTRSTTPQSNGSAARSRSREERLVVGVLLLEVVLRDEQPLRPDQFTRHSVANFGAGGRAELPGRRARAAGEVDHVVTARVGGDVVEVVVAVVDARARRSRPRTSGRCGRLALLVGLAARTFAPQSPLPGRGRQLERREPAATRGVAEQRDGDHVLGGLGSRSNFTSVWLFG